MKEATVAVRSRWPIEQFYQDGEWLCSFGDFQDGRWDGLHRHVALVLLSYSFLSLTTGRLGKRMRLVGEEWGGVSGEAEGLFSPFVSHRRRSLDCEAMRSTTLTAESCAAGCSHLRKPLRPRRFRSGRGSSPWLEPGSSEP